MTGIRNLRSAEGPENRNATAPPQRPRGTKLFSKIGDQLRSDPADLDLVMSDMRIRRQERLALEPLEDAGYQLIDTEVKGFDLMERQVTVIQGASDNCYLVHLPRKILHTASPTSSSLVASLDQLFPADSLLHLISYDVDAIELSLQIWVNRYARVTGRFVPWLHLCCIDGAPRPAQHLLSALQLSSTIDTPQRAEAQRDVTQGDRALISSCFRAYLNALSDAKSAYLDVVRSLGVNDASADKANGTWNDDVSIAAKNLTDWADYQGNGMLGRFIVLLIQDAPGRSDAPRLLSILRECCVVDKTLIQELSQLVGSDAP